MAKHDLVHILHIGNELNEVKRNLINMNIFKFMATYLVVILKIRCLTNNKREIILSRDATFYTISITLCRRMKILKTLNLCSYSFYIFTAARIVAIKFGATNITFLQIIAV